MIFNEVDIHHIDVDLCSACNLKCPMCPRQIFKVPSAHHMSMNKWIKVLDKYTNLKSITLAGAYSEPVLFKHFNELCIYLKSRNIRIEISTNGSIGKEVFWEELGGILQSEDTITFAIDGLTQEVHEKYRVGSDLNKVLHNHEIFKSHNNCTMTHMQFIEFEHNIDDSPNIEAFSIKHGFDKLDVLKCAPVISLNEYNKNIHNKVYPRMDIKKIYNHFDNLLLEIIDNKQDYSVGECIAKDNHKCHLNPHGEVLPCCEFNERSNQKWTKSYQDILDFKYDECAVCVKSFKKQIRTINSVNNIMTNSYVDDV